MADAFHIRRFFVEGYRCVQAAELSLTRLHGLIGPNDSGKSTLLAALRIAISNGASESMSQSVVLEWSDGVALRRNRPAARWTLVSAGPFDPQDSSLTGRIVDERLRGAHLLRLDPDHMRQSCRLIPQNAPLTFDERGQGLPAVYDALLARRRRAFTEIEADFVQLFPQVESLALLADSQTTKQLGINLRGHMEPVAASAMSEGMLYYLAFRALAFLDALPLVLIEEPENGLHPARIAEVLTVLREVSKTTQVVLATHSPLVVNELLGDEISVVTRDDQGTHAVLLANTPDYEQRQTIYKNGELWLGYGDGVEEARLLRGASE